MIQICKAVSIIAKRLNAVQQSLHRQSKRGVRRRTTPLSTFARRSPTPWPAASHSSSALWSSRLLLLLPYALALPLLRLRLRLQQHKALWPLPRCLPRNTACTGFVEGANSRLRGQASVYGLEDRYGAAWHSSQDERIFFSWRKVIIGKIRARQGGAASPLVAVEEVELVRQRAKVSLCGLYQLLKRKKHGGLGK